MILIGELLNSTRRRVREAIDARDAAFVQDLARRQAEAGVAYIDVNTGALIDRELPAMEWLIETVRAATDRPLAIDSPSPEVLRRGLELAGPGTLVNSISAERARLEAVLPLLIEHQAPVIALGMDDDGIPDRAARGFDVLERLVETLEHEGVLRAHIFADPLVRPVGANTAVTGEVLEVIGRLHLAYPDIHISGGVSNVSHGLPCRRLLNRTFLAMGMTRGLDAAIVDPLDERLMSEIAAAALLLGRDEYAMNYIGLFRAGRLEEKP